MLTRRETASGLNHSAQYVALLRHTPSVSPVDLADSGRTFLVDALALILFGALRSHNLHSTKTARRGQIVARKNKTPSFVWYLSQPTINRRIGCEIWRSGPPSR